MSDDDEDLIMPEDDGLSITVDDDSAYDRQMTSLPGPVYLALHLLEGSAELGIGVRRAVDRALEAYISLAVPTCDAIRSTLTAPSENAE